MSTVPLAMLFLFLLLAIFTIVGEKSMPVIIPLSIFFAIILISFPVPQPISSTRSFGLTAINVLTNPLILRISIVIRHIYYLGENTVLFVQIL